MLLTFTTYFIIFFFLTLANSIPVFGSSRTRRFAKLPSLYFFLLLIAFFTFRIIGFLTPDIKDTELKKEDVSFIIRVREGRTFTKPETIKDKINFESENSIDSQQKKYYENAAYILKFAIVQSFFVVLLSYWGSKKFEHRKAYYLPKIRNHSIYFFLCVIIDVFVV